MGITGLTTHGINNKVEMPRWK